MIPCDALEALRLGPYPNAPPETEFHAVARDEQPHSARVITLEDTALLQLRRQQLRARGRTQAAIGQKTGASRAVSRLNPATPRLAAQQAG